METANRTGVVLAGGYSTRFGERDKALAPVDGDPMLVRVVRRLAAVTDTVFVNCRQDQHAAFERTLADADLSATTEFALDEVPDRGPLAGLETALERVDADLTAVVACDMPWVDPTLLDLLFERVDGHDAAVPEQPDGQLQPVQAVYRTEPMRAAVTDCLGADKHSLHAALDGSTSLLFPSRRAISPAEVSGT